MNARMLSSSRPHSRPRGSVFFTALVIIGIMSVTILAMLQYAMYQQRMTHRRVEHEAVYHAAEAGVDQVVHYFNFPSEYASNTSLFTTDAATGSYFTAGGASVFASRGAAGAGLTLNTSSIFPLIFGHEAGDGFDRARVTNLTLTMPTSDDLAAFDRAVVVVNSRAQNDAGQTRIVRATLTADPPFLFKIPAPLISLGGYNANGHLDVHWGEAWFKDDFNMPNGGVNNIPTVSSDSFFNLRTEGTVLLSSGNPAPSGAPLVEGVDPNYYQPWLGVDADHTNIWQHAVPGEIDFPDPLDYDFWKSVAQARGLYFSWNAAGSRMVLGSNGAEIRPNQFLGMINGASEVVLGASGADQVLPPPLIVFVDTLDGNPPAADGSNLCDLSLSGGGETFLRGVVYVCGDIDLNISGMRNIWLQDPNRVADPSTGSETQQTIFMNGLFYAEGLMGTHGSQGVYGSLFTRGGYGGSGAPDIWYDARLGQGLPLSLNSNVTVARFVELHPDIQIAGL